MLLQKIRILSFLSVWVVAVRGLCRRDMRKVNHRSSEKMAYCAKQGGMQDEEIYQQPRNHYR